MWVYLGSFGRIGPIGPMNASEGGRGIGGLGELVRFIRPPVTGRSASSRLQFRFVPCVRAGEAKLCGRM